MEARELSTDPWKSIIKEETHERTINCQIVRNQKKFSIFLQLTIKKGRKLL